MTTPNEKEPEKKEPKKLAKAEIVKMVKRAVPVLDDKGQPKLHPKTNAPLTKPEAIKEEEVMSFAEYDDRVAVVTTSGEKLVAAK